MDVPQPFVEHDQADGAGLEEGVEEGQVRLDPVEVLAPAGQAHDHGAAVGAGDGEDAEAAVEDRPVAVYDGHPDPPVPQGAAAFRQLLGRAGAARAGGGEQDVGRAGEHRFGRVSEELLGAGPQ
ncbi:hypothetical protein ACFXKW_25000 [Streptomyces sp. NPDC059193]|uniref:hypothetical protein n=1 Tax=Streptomyces sp. NPDC059193 TaxID=3346763 RepID=UPI003678FAEF